MLLIVFVVVVAVVGFVCSLVDCFVVIAVVVLAVGPVSSHLVGVVVLV